MTKASKTAKGEIRKCFLSKVKYCYPLRSLFLPHEVNFEPHENNVKA